MVKLLRQIFLFNQRAITTCSANTAARSVSTSQPLRARKLHLHEFSYIMPRPRRIGCIIFVISCHDLFYVSLNKSQQPILLSLHLISYINKVLLCLSVIVGVLSLLILISHLILFHYFFLMREFATLTVGLWILIKTRIPISVLNSRQRYDLNSVIYWITQYPYRHLYVTLPY